MFKKFISHLDPAEQDFLMPEDRRHVILPKPYTWIVIGCVILIPIAAAWGQYLAFGLPTDPSAYFPPISPLQPTGFPPWLRITHWVNFLFLTLLIRSGLSVLFDHPRLYFNNGCTPDSEWIRFTPFKIPKSKQKAKTWTAKDDARYLSPIIGLPGFKHTIGLARIWHFLTVVFFVLNGAAFIALLFFTNQWLRIVPTSWQIFPDAWNVFVHYATIHFPIEPNGFFHYNALQKLVYFGVVFILAPLALLTGQAMSPAVNNRFQWYPKIFGNRQTARSIHFVIMVIYVLFIAIHVALVALTGWAVNMNHIIFGTNEPGALGWIIGVCIIVFVALFCIFAIWYSWHYPRTLQKAQKNINGTLWEYSLNLLNPKTREYTKEDISSYHWPNGKRPESDEWIELAKNDFKDYKLKIGGLVENPREFSLKELKKITSEESITMTNCIQGWSGIAEWKGIPMRKIVEMVEPKPEVTTVAFISFGPGLYGGTYYDTHTLKNCLKSGSILAWEMNYKPLTLAHGAPLRLRIENQLGYKMVKWIKSIKFLKTHKDIGKGYGGKNADDEYFELIANV
jgi:DMSO/TMAO reductase YedYZ molybdopterin-dependent catalytic subunit/thiosulfate reductase cytochrome b subunit